MDIIAAFPTIESGDPELDHFGRREYLTERDIYQAFLELAVIRTDSSVGYLHLYDETTQTLRLSVWSQEVFKQCTTSAAQHYPLAEAGVWGDTIRDNQTVVHNDYPALEGTNGLPDGHFAIQSHMSATANARGRPVAVVGVGNRLGGYGDAEKRRLEDFLSSGWPLVENRLAEQRQRVERLKIRYSNDKPEETMFALLRAVGRAIELRDRYTSRHQSNVSYICDAVALELGLGEEQRQGLRIGASIHDIGKIGVPADLVNAPRELTAAEMALMRTHSATGAAVFSSVKVPWPLVDMIHQHHERMDGSGYPTGLMGEQICIEARIIGVVDSFDSVASHRPYRVAQGKKKAFEEVYRGRGTEYDPYIVDALGKVLSEDPMLTGDTMYIP
jgi:HD-GYP domain-containing protein (c-di-GMP phosphodiesterase class II)